VKLRELFPLLRDSATAFSQDRAPRLAAALAYYTTFSIAPLLFLVVSIAGYFFAGDIGKLIGDYAATHLGEDAAKLVTGMLNQDQLRQGGLIASILGFVTLFMGATGLFAQLQDALNALWGADPAPVKGFWRIVRTRLFAFGMVVFFAVLILVFLAGNTILAAFAEELGSSIGLGAILARVGTFALGTALFTLVFGLIFKYFPDVHLEWKDVWIGAGITAFLFTLGQLLIGLYFARVSPGSVFGAAGSLVVLLLWIYYTAQIVFFGAEITWVYAQQHGTGAGGALSPAKKEALVKRGVNINPAPTPREREAAARTPGAPPTPAAQPHAAAASTSSTSGAATAGGAVTRVSRQPGQIRVPSLWRALTQALYSVLALPALLVFSVTRLVRRH